MCDCLYNLIVFASMTRYAVVYLIGDVIQDMTGYVVVCMIGGVIQDMTGPDDGVCESQMFILRCV